MPGSQEVLGLNRVGCWAFYLFSPSLSRSCVSFTRFREDVQHLMIFPLAVQLGRTKIIVPGIGPKMLEVIVRGSF